MRLRSAIEDARKLARRVRVTDGRKFRLKDHDPASTDGFKGSDEDAAKALLAVGFKAEDYPGGIQEWSEAGYPVEGTMAPKAA